jgi:hypothetical protein
MHVWWMHRKRKHVFRYRVFRPLCSLLPEKLLRKLDYWWPLYRDEADGWTFWTDASYHKYCRKEKRRERRMRKRYPHGGKIGWHEAEGDPLHRDD